MATGLFLAFPSYYVLSQEKCQSDSDSDECDEAPVLSSWQEKEKGIRYKSRLAPVDLGSCIRPFKRLAEGTHTNTFNKGNVKGEISL